MARLRYNGLATGASGSTVGLSLGASLTSGATAVTFNAALTYSNGTAVPTIVSPDYIPLEILDANGRLSEIVWLTAYTAAATTGTITRGQEGSTGVAHSSGDKIAHGPLADDVVSTGVIASTSWVNATNYTTNNPVATLVDTTNLVVSFVAPSSGSVLVEFSGLHQLNSGSQWCEWSVFESGSVVSGTIRQSLNAGSSAIMQLATRHKITGLTPGSSHTYKWGWRATGGATATLYAAVDPALMTVTALP